MRSRRLNKQIVIDTGSLIAIAHLDLIEIVDQFFGHLYITGQVYKESQYDPLKPDAQYIAAAVAGDRLVRTEIRLDDYLDIPGRLGTGEVSSVLLAKKLKCPVMLDDKTARQYAKKHSIPVIGTVGILVIARQNEMISSLDDHLKRLRQRGYYLSDDLVKKAKHMVNE